VTPIVDALPFAEIDGRHLTSSLERRQVMRVLSDAEVLDAVPCDSAPAG
jgi:hypothetical protein